MMLMLLVRPFIQERIGIRILMDIFFSLILFSGVFALRQKKERILIGVFIALPMFAGLWTIHFVELPAVLSIVHSLGIVFFGVTITTILSHLFKEDEVTFDLMNGGICGYLMIGMMWAMMFSVLEGLNPESFFMAHNQGKDIENFIYFSFVTLTTLGYGDITPLTGPARSLVMLEAIVGQLYLTVFIARLVGLHISQSMKK